LEKRKRLFDKFSNQLHILKNEGLLDIDLKFNRTYICPLCVRQFEEADLIYSSHKNCLTEEDAPPDKLFGKRIALTCKECNSKAGAEIDVHLINRIKQMDSSRFYKGSKQQATIIHNDKKISAEISSNGDGLLEVLYKKKNNNPILLDEFIRELKNDNEKPFLNLMPKRQKNETHRVNLALLKTNFILTFSKFGYLFLLDKYYDQIREQIRNTNKYFDSQIFLKDQFLKDQIGTYYIVNQNAKSILNIFSLKTEYSEIIIGAILPLPGKSPEELHNSLISKGLNVSEINKVKIILNTRNYDINSDLFSNKEEIKKLLNWKSTP
jgi:hypothetical protein